LSGQYPYDNYPPNPDWQNNAQQPDYSQNGNFQQHTQYEQSPYVEQTQFVQSAQPDPYAQPQPNMYAPPPNSYGQMAQQYTPTSNSSTGFAIAGLILGILSVVSSWYPFCGLPLPIVGIVMSALGRRSYSYRSMATVGLILSIVAIVIGVVTTTLLLFAIARTSTTPSPGP